LIDSHNYHFSFGENINNTGCRIPSCGIHWIPTRQPVCLPYWKISTLSDDHPAFTTLMNWTAGKILQYNNDVWGQKDIEFEKFLQLPKEVPQIQLSAIVNKTGNVNSNFSKEKIEKAGWKVLDPDENAGNWMQYQKFIDGSYAEFSIAKNTYVKANSGWFSCRSACYLAAGKPVITQNTGWTENIPSGLGLLAFDDMDSAKQALMNVVADYEKHRFAARQIAEEYFDSNKVLQQLLTHLE
jgi:hypothetical protein